MPKLSELTAGDILTGFNLVLYGAPACGKTAWAATAGKRNTLFLDLDKGIRTVATLNDANKTDRGECNYELIYEDHKKPKMLKEFRKIVSSLWKECPYDCVVVDNLSVICEAAVRDSLYRLGKLEQGTGLEWAEWTDAKHMVMETLSIIKDLPCASILIAHSDEKIAPDESVLKVLRTQPKSLSGDVGAKFDEVWFCEKDEKRPEGEQYVAHRAGKKYHFTKTRENDNIPKEMSMNVNIWNYIDPK